MLPKKVPGHKYGAIVRSVLNRPFDTSATKNLAAAEGEGEGTHTHKRIFILLALEKRSFVIAFQKLASFRKWQENLGTRLEKALLVYYEQRKNCLGLKDGAALKVLILKLVIDCSSHAHLHHYVQFL